MKENFSPIKDVVITFSDVDEDDDGNPYATTKVYRYDLGTLKGQHTTDCIEHFIQYVESYEGIMEGSQMKNE